MLSDRVIVLAILPIISCTGQAADASHVGSIATGVQGGRDDPVATTFVPLGPGGVSYAALESLLLDAADPQTEPRNFFALHRGARSMGRPGQRRGYPRIYVWLVCMFLRFFKFPNHFLCLLHTTSVFRSLRPGRLRRQTRYMNTTHIEQSPLVLTSM